MQSTDWGGGTFAAAIAASNVTSDPQIYMVLRRGCSQCRPTTSVHKLAKCHYKPYMGRV